MTHVGALLLAAAGFCMAQAKSDEASATLKVSVCTTFGEPVEQSQIVVTSVGPAGQFKKAGAAVRFDALPLGLYTIEAQAPGFISRKETVGIYQQELSYRVGLAVAAPHGSERTEISGGITPTLTKETDVWVRFVALYDGGLIECQPDQSGKFHVTGIEPGKYVMLVFVKDRLLASREVEFLGAKLTVNVALNTQ